MFLDAAGAELRLSLGVMPWLWEAACGFREDLQAIWEIPLVSQVPISIPPHFPKLDIWQAELCQICSRTLRDS